MGRIVGLLVATWLVVTIGVRVAYADQILPRTTMAGLSLGGLSDEAAQRVLSRTLASRRPVTLTAAGRRFVVTPAAVGYRLDIAASVGRARAAGRQGVASGLGATIPSLLAGRKVQPVARIDHARLASEITAIAKTIDRPASAGAVRVDQAQPGGIGLAAPRAQRTLQRAAAGRVLLAALHDRRTAPVALPVRRRGGATPEEMRAVARRARAYLHRPVNLTAGRRKLMLTTRRTAAILALKRQRASGSGALVLGVDSRAITRLVHDLARDLDHAPSDARISAPARPPMTVDGQGDLSWRPRRADVSVTPGAAGRQLQQDKAVTALTDAVSRGRHRVALSFGREQARITTTAARGVRSLIGTFTTRYSCCQPRVTNIRLIAKDVDGTVVLPGERFSLNEATGERKGSDGYVQAPFIADGKIVPSVGGGVSQFSTTLYNAAYFAGLRIDAHQPHSFYIDRYPAGREATLNFPDIDLRWTNDTSSPVLIRAATDATSVVVSLYGADDGRRVRAQAGERQPLDTGDFQITVTRLLRTADRRLLRQPYTTRYDRPPPPE